VRVAAADAIGRAARCAAARRRVAAARAMQGGVCAVQRMWRSHEACAATQMLRLRTRQRRRGATLLQALWRGHGVRKWNRLLRRIRRMEHRRKLREEHDADVRERLRREGAALRIQQSYHFWLARLASIKRLNVKRSQYKGWLRQLVWVFRAKRELRRRRQQKKQDAGAQARAAYLLQKHVRRRVAARLVRQMKRKLLERKVRIRKMRDTAANDTVLHVPVPGGLAMALRQYRLKQAMLRYELAKKTKKNKGRLRREGGGRKKNKGAEEIESAATKNDDEMKSAVATAAFKRRMSQAQAGGTMRRASAIKGRGDKFGLEGGDKMSSMGHRRRDSKYAGTDGQDRSKARDKIEDERRKEQLLRDPKFAEREKKRLEEEAEAAELAEKAAEKKKAKVPELDDMSGSLDMNLSAVRRKIHQTRQRLACHQRARKHGSALKIQKVFRGHRGRRRMRYYRSHDGEKIRRKKNRARKVKMIEIQRVWRGYKGRKRARDVLKARAATEVKRVWRGWRGRRRAEALRASSVLVTAVQRRVRGALVRRFLETRRQQNKTYGAMARRIQRLCEPWARRSLMTRARMRRRLRTEQDAVSLLRQHAVRDRRRRELLLAQMHAPEMSGTPLPRGHPDRGAAEAAEAKAKARAKQGAEDKAAAAAADAEGGEKALERKKHEPRVSVFASSKGKGGDKSQRDLLALKYATDNDLAALFHHWATDSDRHHMPGAKWKQMLDTAPGLMTNKVNPTLVDLIFARHTTKDGGRLSFVAFVAALGDVGRARFPNPHCKSDAVKAREKSVRARAAKADASAAYEAAKQKAIKSGAGSEPGGNRTEAALAAGEAARAEVDAAAAAEEAEFVAAEAAAEAAKDAFKYHGAAGADGRVLQLLCEHLLHTSAKRNLKPRKQLWAHVDRELDGAAAHIQRRVARGPVGRARAAARRTVVAREAYEARCHAAAAVFQREWRMHAARKGIVRQMRKVMRKYKDPSSGLPYWFNPHSGTVTWSKPKLFGEHYDCAVTWNTPDEWTSFSLPCANCAPRPTGDARVDAAQEQREEADVLIDPLQKAAGGRPATRLCDTLDEAYCVSCWDAVHRRGKRATFTFTPIFMCEDCGQQAATKREWYKPAPSLADQHGGGRGQRGFSKWTKMALNTSLLHDSEAQAEPLRNSGVGRQKGVGCKKADRHKKHGKVDRCDVCHANAVAEPGRGRHKLDHIVCPCEAKGYGGCEFAARWVDDVTGVLSCHRCLNIGHNKGEGQNHSVSYLPYVTPSMREKRRRREAEEGAKARRAELRSLLRATRRERETKAAVMLQSQFRCHVDGRRGRWMLKLGRIGLRKGYRTKKRDDLVRQGVFFKVADKFGRAPPLKSDDINRRVTRRLHGMWAGRRLKALDALNGNLTAQVQTDPKKLPLRGLRVGTEEELVEQALLGGSRMPGTVKVRPRLSLPPRACAFPILARVRSTCLN
jgi:hypothetical protein